MAMGWREDSRFSLVDGYLEHTSGIGHTFWHIIGQSFAWRAISTLGWELYVTRTFLLCAYHKFPHEALPIVAKLFPNGHKVDMALKPIACTTSVPLKTSTMEPSSRSSQPLICPRAASHSSKMRPPDLSNLNRHVCCLPWSELNYHNWMLPDFQRLWPEEGPVLRRWPRLLTNQHGNSYFWELVLWRKFQNWTTVA